MKKKSFFSGYNAKLALTVVALSGALLTGCYKDDGLDVNGPAGVVTLPDPVYTISGNVVDAETLEPIASASVTGGATATVTNGGFSVDVADAGTYNLTVTATGNIATFYEPATATVEVKKLNPGQSNVYSTLVALQPTYNGAYKMSIEAINEEQQKVELAAADYKVTDFAGNVVESLDAVVGGKTYLVTITKEGYVTKYVTVELSKLRTSANGQAKVVSVVLNKAVPGTVRIFGELSINNKPYQAKSIKLLTEEGALLGVDEGYTYNFTVSESLFTTVATTKAADAAVKKEAIFKFVIIDMDNNEIEFTKTVGITSDGGSDSEVDQPIVFKVNTEVSSTAANQKKNVTVDICNDDVDTMVFNVGFTKKTGIISEESDYMTKLAAAGITSNNPLYAEIVSFMEKDVVSEFTKEEMTVKSNNADVFGASAYEIPAQTLLKTMSITYGYNKVVRSIKNIVIEGADVEVMSDVNDASNTLSEATGEVRLGDFVTESVEHSHSHGHGHGGNQSGGGIVDPE